MLHFLLLIIPLLIYIILAVALIFHLKKYGLSGDATKKMSEVFMAVSIILIISAIFMFFSVDWEEFDIAELLQGFIFRPYEYY